MFSYFKISLSEDGLEKFDPEFIEKILILLTPMRKINSPFIKKPRKKGLSFTIILDLDETLIHFPDHMIDTFEKNFPNELRIRPYALQFIKNVS